MFIDIHAHAYRAGTPPQDGHTLFTTPEQVLERYDRADIEMGVLLPLVGPEFYLPQSNEYILDVCEQYKDRFIPFCNLDPRGITNTPDAPFDIWLNHYKNKGCKGVGEFMPNLPFTEPRVLNFFRHCEKVGLPLTFDIAERLWGRYGLYDDPGLPQLEYCLKTFPALKIFGHGPAFWAEIGKLETPGERGGYPSHSFTEEGVVPKLFRRYKNLYGDLSAGSGSNALMRNPDYAIKFLNEFSDRLMFGTDICSPTNPFRTQEFLLELKADGKLNDKVFMAIARENAIRILGLDV